MALQTQTFRPAEGQTVFPLPLHDKTATATVNGGARTISSQGDYSVTLSGSIVASDTVAITYTTIDAPSSSGPLPATATPLAPGVAAVGTSVKYAREDHRHVSDAPVAATVLPLANGTAAIGVSPRYAKEDHVHPGGGAGGDVVRLMNQALPTGVALVDLSTLFTSAYDEYDVFLDDVTIAGAEGLRFRWSVGGAADSSGALGWNHTDTSNTGSLTASVGTSSGGYFNLNDTGTVASGDLHSVHLKFSHVNKVGTSNSHNFVWTAFTYAPGATMTSRNRRVGAAWHRSISAASGFIIASTSGSNITGGTIRVYGYKNA